MLLEYHTPVQWPWGWVDGRSMTTDQRQIRRDIVAGLQSLDLIEASLSQLPQGDRLALKGHVDGLRATMSSFIQESCPWTRQLEPLGETHSSVAPPPVSSEEEAGSFTQVARTELTNLGREARRKGVQLVCEFSPALRTIPFAVGGDILIGLVQQALTASIAPGSERRLTVTASIDDCNRLVIGIEDSAEGGRETYSIRALGTWRRRIGELGGELQLRGVPFGSGTTIQAHLPVSNLAA